MYIAELPPKVVIAMRSLPYTLSNAVTRFSAE